MNQQPWSCVETIEGVMSEVEVAWKHDSKWLDKIGESASVGVYAKRNDRKHWCSMCDIG